MKRSSRLWQLVGFAVTSLLGTVLHFLYGWLGEPVFIAPFSGVNESTWEHMKLIFWPMLLFAIFESFFFKDRADFWCIKLRTVVIALVLIPVIFYTYNGVIGKSPDWVNIAIFFVSAAIAYLYEWHSFKDSADCRHPRLAALLLLAIAVLFVVFTFVPPNLAIFRDPITGGYGV